jgi:hypothetical protein
MKRFKDYRTREAEFVTKMRKSLLITIVLLLFAALGAPNAYAQTYSPIFTCTGICGSLPTATDVSFPSPTSITVTWESMIYTLALPSPDQANNYYVWTTYLFPTNTNLYPPCIGNVLLTCSQLDISDANNGITNYVNEQVCASCVFTAPAYQTGEIIIGTPVITPEPGTSGLMFLAMGLMIVMRKVIAQTFRPDVGTHGSLSLPAQH